MTGRITPNRFVEIVSTAPARMFGLPTKGAVAVGFDADIVVYDPTRKHTLSATTHHMDVDYSCCEGREVTGGSDVVLSRGKVIVQDGDSGSAAPGTAVRQAPEERVASASSGRQWEGPGSWATSPHSPRRPARRASPLEARSARPGLPSVRSRQLAPRRLLRRPN